MRDEVLQGHFTTLLASIEENIQEWVKTAIESSLGKRGTVGALAVDEFFSKLKSAVQEVEKQLSLRDVISSVVRPLHRVGRVEDSVAIVAAPGASVGSEMPF